MALIKETIHPHKQRDNFRSLQRSLISAEQTTSTGPLSEANKTDPLYFVNTLPVVVCCDLNPPQSVRPVLACRLALSSDEFAVFVCALL